MPSKRLMSVNSKSQVPNHKLLVYVLDFKFWICLLFVILSFGFVRLTLASQIATESGQVTATVPAAPPTSTNQPPTAPILLRPPDSTITSDNTPELVWRKSSDPDGNTIYYDVYLNGVATYLGISNIGNSSSANYTTTIDGSEIRLIPTTPLTDNIYQWSVRAYDINIAYTNSAIWHFTIDTAPPTFIVTSIDIHHNLSLDSRDPNSVPAETTFEVSGPKDIYFTVTTEPYTILQLTFFDSAGAEVGQASVTSTELTTLYPYLYLTPGSYTVQIVAIDRANLTSVLPDFLLIVSQPTITIPIPAIPIPGIVIPSWPPTGTPTGPTITIPPVIYDLPASLTNLPVSIARIATRLDIAVIIVCLIAFIGILLLFFLKRHRYNLILTNSIGDPVAFANIHHSIPNKIANSFHLSPSDRGRLYIKGLNRRSTLTIRTPKTLMVVSLARFRSPLTLVV